MADVRKKEDVRDVRTRRNLFTKMVGFVTGVFLFCIFALIISIIVEWVLISTVYKDQGVLHSKTMLETELQYLNNDFKRWIVDIPPAYYARITAQTAYKWLFIKTGLERFVQWVTPKRQVGEPPNSKRLQYRQYYVPVSEYVISAASITQLFAIRMTIAVLSMPAFALLGVVGLVEGLVRRDLRRYGGDREHATVYHASKTVVFPFVGIAWITYLAMPCSLHPNWIFLPGASLFALSLMIMAGTFKKSL